MRWPFPQLIAHRGGGLLAPENTLAALRKSREFGYRAVEFDVTLAAGDVPVLLHDETLQRTTSGHGHVSDTPMEVLALLDAGSWFDAAYAGEPVPSLEAAIALCLELGLWANIEIKPASGQAERAGRRVAERTAARWPTTGASRPLLSSFEEKALAAAREVAPHLPRALLIERPPRDWSRRMAALECIALHCKAQHLDEAIVRAVTGEGYGLAAWTVNDPALARRLLAWGVDALFTDRLDVIPADFAAQA